jgi:O-glycosyl hydrolase
MQDSVERAAGTVTIPTCLLGLMLYGCVGSGGWDRPQEIELAVDPGVEHQEIICFGASGAWSMDHIGSEWREETRQRVADLLFSPDLGIGLSGWKFIIGAGSSEKDADIITSPNEWRRSESFRPRERESYDWSRQAGQQWFLRAAKAYGVSSLHGIAYSPPVWMTKNGHAQPDVGSGTTNLRSGRFADFAAYLADVVKHFSFTDVSPFNEPNWDWNRATQEGNRYSPDEMVTLVRMLHDELARRCVSARIVAPEAGDLRALTGKPYARELIGDPGMRAIVSNTVSAHSYGSDYDNGLGDDRLVDLRKTVRAGLDSVAKDAGFRQTEYCILGPDGPGRDLGMDAALRMARVMHFDLTLMDATEWSWWLSVSPYDYKDGLLYTDYRVLGDPQEVITSKLFWTFGNFSRFVRPGFRRIETRGVSDPQGLMASAYLDPRTGAIVVVLVNEDNRDRSIRIKLSGDHRPMGFVPWLTSAPPEDSLRSLEPVPLEDVCRVPARSVMTLVSY